MLKLRSSQPRKCAAKIRVVAQSQLCVDMRHIAFGTLKPRLMCRDPAVDRRPRVPRYIEDQVILQVQTQV